MVTRQRIRTPDYDLRAYLQNNTDIFTLEEIKNICAEIAGHNDEDSWYWVLELKGRPRHERFVLTQAFCDYTGWDCQSGGSSVYAPTAYQAAMQAPEEEYGRKPRWNLVEQLRGKQPFGLETR